MEELRSRKVRRVAKCDPALLLLDSQAAHSEDGDPALVLASFKHLIVLYVVIWIQYDPYINISISISQG